MTRPTRALVGSFVALSIFHTCAAWGADARAAGNRKAGASATDFEARVQKDADGNALPYRLFKPKGYDAAKKYPVVLFLHGAGERGTDNTKQVRDALYFAADAVQKENPCFVMAPQCPGARPAFQVYGTGKEFDQTYNDYSGAKAGEWKRYQMKLGKLPTGEKTHLVLVNQAAPQAAAPANQSPVTGEFRNITLREGEQHGQAPAPMDLSGLKFELAGGGKLVVGEDKTSLVMTGAVRARAALATPYKVTDQTVMEFEFRSAGPQGLAHAIGLDTSEQFDYRWVQRDWGAATHTTPKEPSAPMRLSMEALEGLKKEFSIDENRLYITGLSMGGYGTWDAIARYPGKFAAAVPVCGGGDEATAAAIKDTPIWCFHGGADKTVKPERSRNMIEAIKKAGGNPKYTEYPGVGHNSWDKAYSDEEMMKWMFAQVKKG